MARGLTSSRLPSFTVAWDPTPRGILVRARGEERTDGGGYLFQNCDDAMAFFWGKLTEIKTRFALLGFIER